MAFGNIITASNQLTNIETFLNNKVGALVSPKTSPGISGFVFDIPEQEEVMLSADITDNFTEDNSFVQDHRVIKPIRITLSGLIGELVIKEDFISVLLQTVQSGLTTVNAFLGDYTDGVGQIIQQTFSDTVNAISRTTQIANRIKNIIEGFDGEGQYRNLQQRAFSNLRALFESQTILTVQTPWKYYESMLIENVIISQGPETELESSITVTLKEYRSASIDIITFADNVNANRNTMQSKENSDTGQIKGTRNSLLFDATSALTGAF